MAEATYGINGVKVRSGDFSEAEKNNVACYHARKRRDCPYYRAGRCRCDDITSYNAHAARPEQEERKDG